MTPPAPMKVLSLCSGIGGLDHGLERAGMTVVGQVEIDPFCQRVLAKHWPNVARHDDVRTAVEWWRSGPRPAVDVVAAGFPCQPWSVAGKQLGRDDPRHLWPAVADVVRDLAPRFVLENVPQLVSLGGLADVLGDLASLGFDAVWNMLPAAAMGAPHLRTRLFILAADPDRVDIRVEPWRGGGSSWPRATVAGFDGATWSVADPSIDGRRPGRPGRPPIDGAARPAVQGAGSQTVADPNGAGRVQQRKPVAAGSEHASTECSSWWATEPDVGRVAHGVSARVDRLRGLGNAVVPQVAEHVGRLLIGQASA